MNKQYLFCLIYIFLISIFIPSISFAQKRALFAEKPSIREQFVQSARERAQVEKQEAMQWALANNCPVRIDDGKMVSELVAIRDGRPIYFTTENVNAAISTGADLVRNTAPYNVDGAGVTVGVWDGGSVLSTHQEFSGGRVTVKDGSVSNWHSTHVGGTVGASGVDSAAKGMAPGVQIDSYDWGSDTSEMGSAAAATPNQFGKIPLSNHSYGSVSGWATGSWSGSSGFHFFGNISNPGDEGFGQYNSLARDYDSVVYNSPYFLPFKSAGNDRNDPAPSLGTTFYYWSSGWQSKAYASGDPDGDGIYKSGYDTIGSRGNAKNIMTVGAANDAVSGGQREINNSTITSFSGWGPSDDGRIKPDIVANGSSLYSCDNDNNSDYTYSSGTSMSSPNACGSAALLVDYYNTLFPASAMRASTLKGLIINTADDIGRPGPDYVYGWGLMNTIQSALQLRKYFDGDSYRLTEALLSNGETNTYTVFRSGDGAVRITLCWTDPPGASTSAYDSRAEKLVNDLDLKVIGPNGTNYPYKLSYSSPTSNATADGENNVDNVEQVYLSVPDDGTYLISVHYDGSTGSGEDQWYSLLVDMNYIIPEDDDQDGIPNDWENQYFGGITNAIASVDNDGDGFDNLMEYIAGTNPTNPASVFEVTSFTGPPSGGSGSTMTWDSVSGRTYSISWSDNLVSKPFTVIQDNIPSITTSYTDPTNRVSNQNFYKVNVRMQ